MDSGPADAELPVRRAARVVVLDPDDRVLLLRYDDGPPNGRHWTTPGGGLEPGEDYATAAVRELLEETGWSDVHVLAHLREQSVVMEHAGRIIRQEERLYLARTDSPARPLGDDVAPMHETDKIAAWRWWTLDELATTSEVVWPDDLAAVVVAERRRR